MNTESPELHRSQESADDVTRALPHAVGPEKSLLSSMLQDPQYHIGLAMEEKLTKEHFYLPANSALYAFLLDLFEKGIEIELVSLVQRLLDKGQLDKVGGPGGLTEIYGYAPSSGHFRHHLQHVKDKFLLRSMIQACNETISEAYDAPDEVAELLDRTEARIMAIRETGETGVIKSLKQTVLDVVNAIQMRIQGKTKDAGLSTGFASLDAMGVRLRKGEMIVIAARPSMGKTSLLMNIVEELSINQGKSGYVASLEMSGDALVERMIYARGKIAASRFTAEAIPTKGELQKFQSASTDIHEAPFEIDERPQLSVGQVRSKARRLHRDRPLDYIAIDYLQLMKSYSKQASNSREREVAEISAGLKGLAKELGVPVIVLAQLNRGPEGRTGSSLGVPRMADLRESGSIEQDADIIGLLHRPEYYATDEASKEAVKGEAKLDIAKHRNGATGTANLTFIAAITRFEDGAPAKELQPQTEPESRYDF